MTDLGKGSLDIRTPIFGDGKQKRQRIGVFSQSGVLRVIGQLDTRRGVKKPAAVGAFINQIGR